jgi:hypothetical protein
MWWKHQTGNPAMEKAQNQNSAQRIYLEAYCYSLELCENPEIARRVASRFLASMEQKEQASTTLGLAKA